MKNRIPLLAAVVGLPFVSLACSDDEPANAVPDDVGSVVQEYAASWNDYDSEAFLELVTADYVFISEGSETDREAQAGIIGDGALSTIGFFVEDVGDSIAIGDGPYYVASTQTLDTDGGTVEGISTVTVVDDGGELKVSEHIWTD
jgi:hypothetical protein